MKKCCSCLLGFAFVILTGCMSISGYKETSLYQETSLRHHAYTTGTTPATTTEWRTLISEFQKVIDSDVQGPSADDAQYAIASSWVWSIKAGDTEAPKHAIEAFRKLIHTYPNSEYVPLAHYWLGHCYAYIGDDFQAIVHYRLVENRYAQSEVADPAKLALARTYAKQGYGRRAETFYEDLVNTSTNQEVSATASKELQVLKTREDPGVPPPKKSTQPQPKQQQPKQSKPDPKPLAPKSLTREFGLTAKTIVIDPGHGGKDPGGLGGEGLQEKGIVLGISHKLREVLSAKGYTVLMTRDTDHFIPLKERTAFAIQHKADLFLSIHANASENSQANGIETYYLDVNSTDKASEEIAARENMDSGYSIQELETLLNGLIRESKSEDSNRLARHIQATLIQQTGAVDRGVKHARFVVLIGTNVPAILIETGFLTNPVERQKLETSAYQHKIATAIAQGVERFLGKTEEPPLVEVGSPTLTAKSAKRTE